MENKFGKFTISGGTNVSAGSFAEINFKFEPSDDFVVAPRTMIEIVQFSRFYSNQFSSPQTNDPTAPGYVYAKRSDGKFINTVIRRIPDVYHRHGSTYHVIQLTMGEESLEKGGFIEIFYGYKAGGGPGTQCPPIAKCYYFPVYISQRHALGIEKFMSEKAISFESLFVKSKNVSTNEVKNNASFNPSLTVSGGNPEKLKIIVSPRSISKAMITVNVTDFNGNPSPMANGIIEIQNIGSLAFKKGYGQAHFDIKGKELKRVTGYCSHLNLSAVSNPFMMGQNIAWGEIHSHSGISDGLGTDEENYNSAVYSGLDFAALSDHDTLMELDDSLWSKTIDNAKKYKDEPNFITLLGYEALAYKDGEIAGHINIYYPGDEGQMAGRPNLKKIAEMCNEQNAIAIPHHTMYGGPFFEQMGLKMEHMEPNDFNSAIMPVTEIYSTHGCSETPGCERSVLGVNPERSVNSALQKGFKWGFIGGSDNHESLLGHGFRVDKNPRTINNEHMQFRHGITAAYVDEFSREGIFKALKKRCVYATTGERILLSLSINGHPMGSEFKIKGKDDSVEIIINIAGTSIISRVEIIRNGEIIHQRNPESLICNIFFIDEEISRGNSYYYVKVIQSDGEMAWSSPIWISLK